MRFRLTALIILLAAGLSASHAQPEDDQFIVILEEGHSIDQVNRSNGTRTVDHVSNTPVYLITGDNTSQQTLKKLKIDRSVEVVEKNRSVKLRSPEQAGLSPSLVQAMASLLDGHTLTTFYGTTVLKAYVEQPALDLTEVSDVRSISTGAATRVAYIDTGVDFNHPALGPWLDPGVDLVNGRSASEMDGLSQAMASLLDQAMASLLDRRFLFVLDQAMASLLDGGNTPDPFPGELGHGTLVAGVIHVVAPSARIVPIKAFDAYGNTSIYTIIKAVYKARDLDVDVLNMSFSTEEESDALRRAVGDLQGSGTAVVASVGNDASGDKNVYPAAYLNVIGVAATDFNDHLADFSNYGKAVSVDAPGAFVVSTVPGGRYAAAWGTSFSAPIVAGAVAVVASARGHGQSDVSQVITTADFIDNLNPGFERKLGRGRINIRQALKLNKK